jgi:hypothetical protein
MESEPPLSATQTPPDEVAGCTAVSAVRKALIENSDIVNEFA